MRCRRTVELVTQAVERTERDLEQVRLTAVRTAAEAVAAHWALKVEEARAAAEADKASAVAEAIRETRWRIENGLPPPDACGSHNQAPCSIGGQWLGGCLLATATRCMEAVTVAARYLLQRCSPARDAKGQHERLPAAAVPDPGL